GRNEDPRIDLERHAHALERKVHAGVDFGAVAELPVVVEMEVAGLLEAVEAPEAAERGVRPELLQLDEVPRTEAGHHRCVVLAIAAAAEETNLRIELVTDLLVPQIQIPLLPVRLRPHVERVVVTR